MLSWGHSAATAIIIVKCPYLFFYFRNWRWLGRIWRSISISGHVTTVWQRTFSSWQRKSKKFGSILKIETYLWLFVDFILEWSGLCHWPWTNLPFLFPIPQNQRYLSVFRWHFSGSFGIPSHRHDHWGLRFHCSLQWLFPRGCQFSQKNTNHWFHSQFAWHQFGNNSFFKLFLNIEIQYNVFM